MGCAELCKSGHTVQRSKHNIPIGFCFNLSVSVSVSVSASGSVEVPLTVSNFRQTRTQSCLLTEPHYYRLHKISFILVLKNYTG